MTDPRVVRRAMGALVVAIVVASLDGTMVATALPLIVSDLGGLDQLPLVISAYMLASTVTLPLYGRWSDALGRKPLLLLAQSLFMLGGILASTASSMSELVAFRSIQGAGAGGLMVLAQAIIGDMVRPRDRSRYLGWISALFATGSVAGPVVGGLIADYLGWEWVFRLVVPVGIVGLVGAWLFVPRTSSRMRVEPDLAGTALLTLTLASLVMIATWAGSTYEWGSATILALGGVFVISATLLVAVERRHTAGIIPIEFFRIRGVAPGMVVVLVSGSTIFGFIVFTPVFAQLGLGTSATMSGMVTLPLMVSFMVGSVLVGRAIARLGRYRIFPIVGTALITVSFVLLSTMDSNTSLITFGMFLVIGGAGVSMVMQVVVLAMQTTVEPSRVGVATSMTHLFRSMGGVLGIATLGSLLSARLIAELSTTGLTAAGISPESIVESPGLIAELEPVMAAAVRDAAAASVTFVFAVSVPLTLVALISAFRIPDRYIHEVADA